MILRGRFLVIVTVILAGLSGCGGDQAFRRVFPGSYPGPRAVNGVIDVRGVDLPEGIPLDGEWLFYPEQFMTPDELDGVSPAGESITIDVPGAWNTRNTESRQHGGQGFGTYQLEVITDHRDQPLYLWSKEISTAYRAYIGDHLADQAGVAGSTRDAATPQWSSLSATATASDGRLLILIQVSNFHHARGGIRDEVLLSSRPLMEANRLRQLSISYFLFGALLLMGTYHLGLYYYGRQEVSTLWFGLATLLMALRTVITGSPAILRGSTLIEWEALLTAEYLTMFLGVPLFVLYTGTTFPEELNRMVSRVAILVGAGFTLVAIVTPAWVFTATLYPFHIFVVSMALLLTVAAVRAWRAGRSGGGVYTFGVIILSITVFNDILYSVGVIRTGPMANIGLFVFLFFQSLVIASRCSISYRRIEELLQEKSRLEQLTFRDGLTGTSNRRHFDATMTREWTRAQRHGHSLSMVMIDIDHFKPFNDTFGHPAGDEVLRAVANALTSCLSRASDFLARYGGEEFASILPATDREGAARIAKAMRLAVEAIQLPGSRSGTRMTASFGVASIVPNRDTSSDTLINRADVALYQAKQNGRNRVEVD